MFADNDQISGKQLFYQMTLGLLGAMILVLPGREILGIRGAIACGIAFLCLLVHCFWLTRLAPVYGHLEKYVGRPAAVGTGLVYLAYYILTGAFVIARIGNMISYYMILKTPLFMVHLVIILACAMAGTPKIQSRGRMAEFCLPFFICLLFVMMILAFWQNKSHFSGYLLEKREIDVDTILQDMEILLLSFTCINGVPFLLGRVKEKRFISLAAGTGTVLAFTAGAILLLQGCYGQAQTEARSWPMLSLMAGIRILDGTLSRMDSIWIALLMMFLLFSVGSTFFYGNYIVQQTGLGIPWYVIYGVVFVISLLQVGGMSIAEFYMLCVRYFFAPVMFLWNGYLIFKTYTI